VTTTRTAARKASVCPPSHACTHAPDRPGPRPRQRPPAGRVGVDERGEPRVRPRPAGRPGRPPHRPGPGPIEAQHRCRHRLGQPPRRGGDQRPVRDVPGHSVLGRHVGHRPVRPGDRRAERPARPVGQPRPRPDPLVALHERPAVTGRLGAEARITNTAKPRRLTQSPHDAGLPPPIYETAL
jgi:hypothetical protein